MHVDAYRLGGIGELDDLDLDTSLDEAVTVVEWGTGIAEGLADSRLEVRIARGATAPDPDDPRPPHRHPRPRGRPLAGCELADALLVEVRGAPATSLEIR